MYNSIGTQPLTPAAEFSAYGQGNGSESAGNGWMGSLYGGDPTAMNEQMYPGGPGGTGPIQAGGISSPGTGGGSGLTGTPRNYPGGNMSGRPMGGEKPMLSQMFSSLFGLNPSGMSGQQRSPVMHTPLQRAPGQISQPGPPHMAQPGGPVRPGPIPGDPRMRGGPIPAPGGPQAGPPRRMIPNAGVGLKPRPSMGGPRPIQ